MPASLELDRRADAGEAGADDDDFVIRALHGVPQGTSLGRGVMPGGGVGGGTAKCVALVSSADRPRRPAPDAASAASAAAASASSPRSCSTRTPRPTCQRSSRATSSTPSCSAGQRQVGQPLEQRVLAGVEDEPFQHEVVDEDGVGEVGGGVADGSCDVAEAALESSANAGSTWARRSALPRSPRWRHARRSRAWRCSSTSCARKAHSSRPLSAASANGAISAATAFSANSKPATKRVIVARSAGLSAGHAAASGPRSILVSSHCRRAAASSRCW